MSEKSRLVDWPATIREDYSLEITIPPLEGYCDELRNPE
jgi:hypothetical protein